MTYTGYLKMEIYMDWAGLSPYLIIKQVLMRFLKSTGERTCGTGFSEIQRTIWLLSMPVCVVFEQDKGVSNKN